MKYIATLALALFAGSALADDGSPDSSRDILVTFQNEGARQTASGTAPYRFRKRYALSSAARSDAKDIALAYGLQRVDDWPIKSLSVYCFVFRVPDDVRPEDIVAELQSDKRIESVQVLNRFETGLSASAAYDDTYANLQHGLDQLNITEAHSYTKGEGVRIVVIDSHVDLLHEDLKGRINSTSVFIDDRKSADVYHGTAIVSVIGATANNARGIVGVAPEARIDLHVACWLDTSSAKSICDSFTLAKALDAVAEDPPDVLNMSLTGPRDALLGRLIDKIYEQGTVIVAAEGSARIDSSSFPASHEAVIGVDSSTRRNESNVNDTIASEEPSAVFAPGWQIMVAVPNGGYDFRSGSSIAAAHVSGVVALVLATAPGMDAKSVQSVLRHSRAQPAFRSASIDACRALQLTDESKVCTGKSADDLHSKLKPNT